MYGYRRQEQLEVIAVVDGSAARRAAATRAAPGIVTHATLAGALDEFDVDFLDVCTPPSDHLAAVRAGLERGLWVLCEKPIVRNVTELECLTETLVSEDGHLYPCHNYGFAPSICAVQELLNEHGSLGPEVEGRFWTERIGHARGVSDWDEHWRRNPDISGGGIVADHGPHSTYIASRLIGRHPKRLRCTVRPGQAPWTSTEERAWIELDFDGAQVSIALSWAASKRRTGYELRGRRGQVSVVGDELSWEIDGYAGQRSFSPDFDDPSHGSWFVRLLCDVAERMDRSDHNLDLIEESFLTVVVIDACYRSALAGGAKVSVPQLRLRSQLSGRLVHFDQGDRS